MDKHDTIKLHKLDIPFLPDAWFIKSFKTRTSKNNNSSNVQLRMKSHIV